MNRFQQCGMNELTDKQYQHYSEERFGHALGPIKKETVHKRHYHFRTEPDVAIILFTSLPSAGVSGLSKNH